MAVETQPCWENQPIMQKTLIVNDAQIPFHDPLALKVLCEIAAKEAPFDQLIVNGDWGDFYHLNSKYPKRVAEFIPSRLKEELEIQASEFRKLVKAARPKKIKWNDGNHEWRVMREMMKSPEVLQIMGLATIADSLNTITLLKLNDLKIEYAGEYPSGCWLDNNQRVWVEHSYMTRSKSGFGAHAHIDSRMCSTVIGHCERLALVWKKAVGGREFFGIEGGNLSILAQPTRGDGIYRSVPMNIADYRNSQQGFSIIYHDSTDDWPVPVRIHNGKAVWQGRLYKA